MSLNLHELARRALRLSEHASLEPLPTPPEVIEERLERWRAAVAPDDPTAFHRRLRWRGGDEADARLLLRDRRLDTLPAWTAVVADIVAAVAAGDVEHPPPLDALRDPAQPLPFEELLLPAVGVARVRLAAALEGPASALERSLDPVARRAFERALLIVLCERAGPALAAELAERSLGARLFGAPRGDARYRRFVAEQRADGLCAIFTKYPALARLLGEGIALWVASRARLFRRLAADAAALEARFGAAADRVVSAVAGLSDPHHGNESVCALRFQSGLELVYKPKDVRAERAFGELLAWCHAEGLGVALRAPKVLCGDGYGWVEFIETKPLARAADIPVAFERAGALTCLLYALRATDFHVENLITSGADLVPIDMEALLHADPAPLDGSPAEDQSQDLYGTLLGSVMRSGLLPQWTFDGDRAYDYSGIGSVHPENVFRTREWSGLGSDALDLGTSERDLTLRPRWSLDGAPVDPAAHIDAIVRGFERCYRFLLARREALLAGPLRALRGIPQRYIFRETRIYGRFLSDSFAPEALRSGLARSLHIDKLARAYLYPEMPACFPLLEAEREAIERGDIPFFGCASDGTALTVGVRAPVEGVFQASAWRGLRRQLARLGSDDLRVQRDLLRASFDTVQLRGPASRTVPTWLEETESAAFRERPALTPDDCLALGLRLAERIHRRAIRGADGGAGFIVPRLHGGDGDKYHLHLMPPGLYSGLDGVALTLAAADAAAGQERHRGLVRRLLFPLFDLDPRVAIERRPLYGLGLNAGYGALAYSLSQLTRLTGDEEYAERALAVLELLDPSLIEADRQLDLLGGSAGLLVGLHALQEVTEDARLLPLARRCGAHLLARQERVDGRPPAWKTIPEAALPLAGLSHGAAGIALALTRLAAWSGEERFAAAAREGIAYERSVFDASRRNWPDFRAVRNNGGQPAFMNSWCHGATGIGLARLACLPQLGSDAALEAEIEHALAGAVPAFGRCDLDHVCCGNFGKIALLLNAGRQLDRPQLLARAYRAAAALAARAEANEGFLLFKGVPGRVFEPQLFQGLGGIAYQLLRLARPELPAVEIYGSTQPIFAGAGR